MRRYIPESKEKKGNKKKVKEFSFKVLEPVENILLEWEDGNIDEITLEVGDIIKIAEQMDDEEMGMDDEEDMSDEEDNVEEKKYKKKKEEAETDTPKKDEEDMTDEEKASEEKKEAFRQRILKARKTLRK